ncbi:MAG TPA: hypothetical protein VNA25_21905 [Phycisphaerae bacterium]|nr:hypothetical protein [Phycisphaerae bacterium]
MVKKRWLFAAKVLDKPGVLTAVSAVLSNRGVSVQMTLGSTLSLPDPQSVPLFYVFEATDGRMNELLRAVRRLPTVLSCECFPYDSDKLRAVAFAHVDPRRLSGGAGVPEMAAAESVAFAPIACDDEHETWVLMSTPREVSECLAHLKAAGALLEVSMTIIPVE